MIAAGVVPDFPRPAPPRKFTAAGWLLIVAGPLFVVWLLTDADRIDRSNQRHERDLRPAGSLVE
ncbi:MAG: hypothetical protein EOP84_34995 [Verrucomicrobiaceae bacterium]|nr:MAG: hypothetical protein EOP84_34995 [Verrucomicrobiaceae bacterium]